MDIFGKDTKIIYRQYATLYFIFVVDESESNLGIMDLIRLYVDVLDMYFTEVCELDIIFNVEKCYAILDEIIQGGIVTCVNKDEILSDIRAQDAKMEIETDERRGKSVYRELMKRLPGEIF